MSVNAHHDAACHPHLTLYLADRFFTRLFGVHRFGSLAANQGVCLAPCQAVHTFGMRQRIDVVFLSRRRHVLRCYVQLPPYRLAYCKGAYYAVELSGGYLHRHADYLVRINQALDTALSPQ